MISTIVRSTVLLLAVSFFAVVVRPAAGIGVLYAAEGEPQNTRKGNWSARSRAGVTINGTWTATADPKTGSVAGTWTLEDGRGGTVRRGGWSAAKSAKGWSGAWRAAVSGSKGEYSGTWTADVELKPNAAFADLFALAAKSLVSGSWRAAGQSGAWSIRAFE